VRFGIDVRIDPDRDLRAHPPRARQGIDPLDLARRLDVDRADAEIDGVGELGRGLADAGEDDLRRGEPGAQRDVDLAAGVGIGAAAEAAQACG